MSARPRTTTVLASTVLAALMVFVLSSSAIASATPTPTAGTPQALWAYGFVKTVSAGPLRTSDGWAYDGKATLGYSVILNQTNTSATTFELSVHRTMGVMLSVEFCKPSCGAASSYGNLSARAWEVSDSRANFTTQGTVNESSGPVSAIALINASSSVEANLTESAHSSVPLMHGGTVVRSKSLSASISGTATVAFTPSLGLFPEDLGSGQSWSAGSQFSATGMSNYSYYSTSRAPLANVTLGPVHGSTSVAPQGTVNVSGSYSPGAAVSFGSDTYPAITLTVAGPFTVREGFILIPGSSDLFGASPKPWAANQTGATMVQMASLDAKASDHGHFGLAASAWVYASSSANPAENVAGSSAIADVSPSVSSMNPLSTTTIQGAPETVSQAQSDQQCLTSGVGCPAPSGAGPRSPLGAFGIVVVVGAVGALIALVLVAERRRVPPPTYPNANLYPPGVPVQSSRARSARPGETPPEPVEEDPLDHLW
jgi:hypothetical protein